jgi:hypothetical protein
MPDSRRILVTGATGKVGEHLLARLLSDARFEDCVVRALCHNRIPNARPRLEIARGSIASRESVELAMRDVTHVVHLATCKELPELIMDVTVKGLFWLLEASRQSTTFEQLVLLGGDAAVGHCYFPKSLPVTEADPHTAYPGCYALSKVLEEVVLEQYYRQYDLNGCCLRAPWIMEKDDFKYHLSFAEDQFGAPRFRELVGAELAAEYQRTNTVPIALDIAGIPLQPSCTSMTSLLRCSPRSITPKPANKPATSPWTNRSTTAKSRLTWPRLEATGAWQWAHRATVRGSTIAKPNPCWAGDRATTIADW